MFIGFCKIKENLVFVEKLSIQGLVDKIIILTYQFLIK